MKSVIIEFIGLPGCGKSGIVESIISNLPNKNKLLQFYVANYETFEWGKSAELIASILMSQK
jgi:GTPase SAR1 family protein